MGAMRSLVLILLCACSGFPDRVGLAACGAHGGVCRVGQCAYDEVRITLVDCNPDRNPGGAVCCAPDAGT